MPLSPQQLVLRSDWAARAATLLAHLTAFPTATAAMTTWCAERWPGEADAVEVHLLAERQVHACEDERLLKYAVGETLCARSVQLHWGRVSISEAENWYVPSRLPLSARQMLKQPKMSFGTAIGAFAPSRHILEAEVVEAPGAPFFLMIKALVSIGGIEIAEVREYYDRGLFQSVSPPSGHRLADEETL